MKQIMLINPNNDDHEGITGVRIGVGQWKTGEDDYGWELFEPCMAIWTQDGAFALVHVPQDQLTTLIKEVFTGLRVEIHFPFKIKERPDADATAWFSNGQAIRPPPPTLGRSR